jgi:hypothetical protein
VKPVGEEKKNGRKRKKTNRKKKKKRPGSRSGGRRLYFYFSTLRWLVCLFVFFSKREPSAFAPPLDRFIRRARRPITSSRQAFFVLVGMGLDDEGRRVENSSNDPQTLEGSFGCFSCFSCFSSPFLNELFVSPSFDTRTFGICAARDESKGSTVEVRGGDFSGSVRLELSWN